MATTTGPAAGDPPALTAPMAATRLGATLWELEALLAARPDLAARAFRAGGRRMVLAADLPLFRAALADRAGPRPAGGA